MNDKEIIKRLGGPTAVAKKLGFEGRRGVCRVIMWQRRGIPAKVRLEHLGYFLAPLNESNKVSEKPCK